MNERNIRNIFYYKNYYLDFFNSLDYEVRQKFNWTLKLLKFPTYMVPYNWAC
jgi:hypothetical protein